MLKNIYDLETPVLLVDLSRLEANIAAMNLASARGGKRLRPHIKTHKTPEIAKMQCQAGAVGLTVAKLGEAEVMAAAGLVDIFVANEIVGSGKIERLMALLSTAKISVGTDSIDVAIPIAEAASRIGRSIPLRIEIDSGHGRTGVTSVEEAVELAEKLQALKGIDFEGVYSHEGQTYLADGEEGRQQAVHNAARFVLDVVEALQAKDIVCDIISMGSTPGAKFLAGETGINEMRPGSYVFNDRMQVGYGADPADCALTVLSTIISVRPGGRMVLDAGTKSLASDRPFADGTYGEISGHPELMFMGASEEHGNLRVEGHCALRVGDKVRVVPNHVCTCVNMHDALTVFRGEAVEAVWKIAARGKVR